MACSICGGKVPPGRAVCEACKARLAPTPRQSTRPTGADPAADIPRLLREGRLREAAALCRQYVDGAPTNPDAHVLNGDIAAAQGRMHDAAASYTQALQFNPRRRDEVIQKLHDATDASRRTGGPALVIADDDDDEAAPIAMSMPAPPVDDTPADDAVVEFAPDAPSPPPTPLEEPEIDYVSPLAEYLSPRTMQIIIAAAVLAVLLSLLFSLRPWQPRYHAPNRVIPIPLEPETPMGLPPADSTR